MQNDFEYLVQEVHQNKKEEDEEEKISIPE